MKLLIGMVFLLASLPFINTIYHFYDLFRSRQ